MLLLVWNRGCSDGEIHVYRGGPGRSEDRAKGPKPTSRLFLVPAHRAAKAQLSIPLSSYSVKLDPVKLARACVLLSCVTLGTRVRKRRKLGTID